MSGYEVEHNISSVDPNGSDSRASRRPDLSTYYSTLREVDTSPLSNGAAPQSNIHALPLPENVTAVYRLLAEAIQAMVGEHGHSSEVQESLINNLLMNAHNPPKEVVGMPESFFDGLERVPKSKLKKDQDCPICGQPFLDDPYPLVVKLPCHDDHRFDLECIKPWLKINTTCPLDRKDLLKKKAPEPPPRPDSEDGEYDDFYA